MANEIAVFSCIRRRNGFCQAVVSGKIPNGASRESKTGGYWCLQPPHVIYTESIECEEAEFTSELVDYEEAKARVKSVI